MNVWPSWRYGPNGQAKIFQRPEDVPDGWADSPDRVPKTEVNVEPPREPKRLR